MTRVELSVFKRSEASLKKSFSDEDGIPRTRGHLAKYLLEHGIRYKVIPCFVLFYYSLRKLLPF